MSRAGLWWITRDFRLRDNPALLAAISEGPLLPVFFIDKLTLAQGSASRWRLERGLRALDATLRQRTGGRGITLLRGEPDDILPRIAGALDLRNLHQTDWPAPEMIALQNKVMAALEPNGAVLERHAGHLLTKPDRIRTNGGGAYKVYTPFARALRRLGADAPVADAPAKIMAFDAGLPELGDAEVDLDRLNLAPDLYRGRHALEHFALPVGEDAAQDRLFTFLDHAQNYGAGRDRPDMAATSQLSEHLALGEISPRSIWAVASLRAEIHPAAAEGISQFLSEIIWREFAWHLLIEHPDMPKLCWRREWEGFPWRRDGAGVDDWTRAQTGVALVDAGLREMWLTGRMHNRVRMVVASWLTKHLVTDWRVGLAHFADCLTDWDPASNAMNWQWVAGCGPDASPYFRIFNPQRQQAQFDPQGIYCKRWLKGFDRSVSADAALWAESIPYSWGTADDWREGPAEKLTLGREDALRALSLFRGSQDPANVN